MSGAPLVAAQCSMTYFLFTQFDSCGRVVDTQSFVVCSQHARDMPTVDGTAVQAERADHDATCDFCSSQSRSDR